MKLNDYNIPAPIDILALADQGSLITSNPNFSDAEKANVASRFINDFRIHLRDEVKAMVQAKGILRPREQNPAPMQLGAKPSDSPPAGIKPIGN